MHDSIGARYLEDVVRNLGRMKALAERGAAQVSDEQFFATLDAEANSIAIVMKHMSGNMRSRWTDFLTSDGEKPDRNRDAEFELEPGTTRARVLEWWEAGWRCVFDAVGALSADDLDRTVRIRGEPLTVLEAINRQLTHYAYHVGQIVLLAKHLRGSEWRTLSIPRRRE